MTEYFKVLTEEEYDKLKDAIALITVLIAGVDGEINNEEKAWADKVTKIRSYNMSEDLIGFYQEVGKDFQSNLDHFILAFPNNPEQRTKLISDRLSHLNPILAKLDPSVAYHLLKSYKSFAKHVAKSTGGFLGFFAINKHEAALIGLPMIDPIPYTPEEEEEE